ncbi:hypothetical protein COU58_02690 [Candidatus Pacearchaeota archaeon CG10_big_fil_rev_8_21_14_0_10_32_42]|nr:MAG: hypothetical protein COU58_02690 [Candidatus Pacearchaeota archaeon CG10_big_fil_rev_8_21_14_0_10_32_42]
MKTLISLFVIFSLSCFAQDFEINKITLSTGMTSLTKGLTLSVSFNQGENYLITEYNAELGQVLYLVKLSDNFSFGPTAGFLKNVLWFAPIITASFFNDHVRTLHWAGWSFGNCESAENEIHARYCFSFQSISILVENFEASYALQHYYYFQPEHIFSLKKEFNLNDKFMVFFSGGYMLMAEDPLWAIGGIYKFK